MERKQLNSQLWTVDVISGAKQPLAKVDAVQPSWSPHGQRIAYWGIPSGSGRRVVWTLPAGGGQPVPAVSDDHINWNPVWSPDGRFLYFVSDHSGSMNLWRIPIDESTGRPLGEPQPITPSSQSLGLLSLSRDGRQLVYATDEGKANLERRPLDPVSHQVSGDVTPVTQGSRVVRSSSVSPDGRWIVFDISTPQEDLFVVHADGTGEVRQLTTDAAKDRLPQWLADNQHIVFYSNRGGSTYGLWTIRMDGSELQRLPFDVPDGLFSPLGSPDGRRMVATPGHLNVALLDSSRPPAERIRLLPAPAEGEVFAASSWSPDGKYLAGALEQARGGASIPGVVLYSFATGRYERLTDKGTVPAWLHDGHTLLYRLEGKILECDLRTKASRVVLTPPSNSAFNSVSVGPDDRAIYAVRASEEGDIWMLTLPGVDER
jgi:Tol biopolymer transport system component